ncbi:MAG: PQQ-dependent sugar dehydrogenase [Planctomycetota bacterium]|nr:PQQ-dependent sugar dehydrogenase [Planctomycetota bacterium]
MPTRLMSVAVLSLALPPALACTACAEEADTPRPGLEELTTELVADGLSDPLFATHAPGDFTRLFILEQNTGDLEILNLQTGQLNAQPFLELAALIETGGSEQGLLGLAFHPDYRNNGFFYVNYTGLEGDGDTVVARYSVTDDPDVADPDSAEVLLTIDQPQRNHNGGWMGFGPADGYLYIATGDGGGGGDDDNGHTPGVGNGQDITDNLLGKILRIDVDGGSPYAIPADNPFVDIEGDDEIWAFGLRNPWRCSFDRETAEFWIADVGQNAWEEVDYQPAASAGGENYGWRCREGAHDFNTEGDCSQTPFTGPVHEYSHGGDPFRCSITGGYVYRGCAIPSYRGRYFFADYCSDQIWSFSFDGENVSDLIDHRDELDPPGNLNIASIASFGEDARGELYICDLSGGEVFRVGPVEPTISPADFDCDGSVDTEDLLSLLAVWGDCDGCIQDLDGDGAVGTADLLALLGQWG